jgi:diaminopimelate decarboxylase
VYRRARELPNIRITGLDCHIGSQLTDTRPFVDALARVLDLARALEQDGIALEHLDLGGGLGVRYRDEQPPQPQEYLRPLLDALDGCPYEILIEPGRAIVANAGLLLTRVTYLKCSEHKNFAIVDAAMNDLLRPALYGAWQDIVPVAPRTSGTTRTYDVVGPVCETGDFLGKDRELTLEPGDLLAVRSAGAYGFSMSSNYNTRPRAVELLVDGEQVHVARQRESLDDLMRGESVLAD